MLILIFINIFIIVWIYSKYYNYSQNENIEKKEIENMEPIITGCINDRGLNNNFDLILAEIINLNIKGYIKIEYDRNDINAYDYTIKQNIDMNSNDIKKYEIILLNFLFSKKMEITKKELEERLINTFNSYNVQYNDLQEVLQKELVKENIIDENKQKELQKISKIYKKESMILIIVLLIIKIFIFKNISSLSILIYIAEKIISNILIIKSSNYTEKGEKLKKYINEYKNELSTKEFLIDKKTMNEIIFEKEFANSLALHINTQAKRVFIDDQISKNATKNAKKVALKFIILLIIFIFIGIILQHATKSMTKDGIVWLYIMLTIIVAFSADITKIR